MAHSAIEYLRDTEGQPSAVVIPIDLWRKIFPDETLSTDVVSFEDAEERFEDYCMNKAMDEAAQTPVLDREAALAFLEEDSD